MYYVYVLKSISTDKLYFGYTEDLRKRFVEHNRRYSQATKTGAPYELIYYEAYRAKKDALSRETQLKKYKQGYSRLKERIADSIKGQN